MRRARQIQCVNNVRQLGIVLHEFVSDNHIYPLEEDAEYDKSGFPINFNTWVDTLGHQLGLDYHRDSNFWNKGIWLCPSAQYNDSRSSASAFESYGYNAVGIGTNLDSLGLGGHYGLTHFTGVGSEAVFKPPINESDIVSPSEMMSIGDGFEGNGSQFVSGQGLLWRNPSYTGWEIYTAATVARHQSKANVVFCDGHVESLTLQFLFADTSDAALCRWNRDHQPHRERLAP